MKRSLSPQDEAIIELLKRLGALRAEYPTELLAARRADFASQIEQRKQNGANKNGALSKEQVLALLGSLKPVRAEYPSELLSARRAAFIAQIDQRNNGHVPEEASSQDQDRVIQLLGDLKSVQPEYPPELLAARRAAFTARIRQHNSLNVVEASEAESQDRVIELLENLRPVVAEYPPQLLSVRRAAFISQIRNYNNSVVAPAEERASSTGKIFGLLGRLKSIEIEYPLKMWSARRSAFITQVRDGKTSVLDALRLAIQNMFGGQRPHSVTPVTIFRRVSMVVAMLLMVVFIGSLAKGSRQPLTQVLAPVLSQTQSLYSSPVAAITNTAEDAQVICKDGYLPPLCLAQEFDQSRDLTFQGNGSARPAVAKDTVPGHSKIHQAAYVNDGLYGPGASWISNSAYSWIKIDLGKEKTINTVTFGRDRLGNLDDGDPGQFVIAVALEDDVYADGNSSNDYKEYTPVYKSREVGFDGLVAGAETIEARFEPVQARFIKITFENSGTAVDEIEAFMLRPSEYADVATRRPRAHLTVVPASFTPVPTNTLVPSKTPTRFPTRTPYPTITWIPTTLVPTNTARPTSTPNPPTATPHPPTSTPRPTSTEPPPTETPVPPPTDTPVPPPTETPEPPPTNTPPPPPTDSPEPPPSDTPVPPVDTPQMPASTSEVSSTGTPGISTAGP